MPSESQDQVHHEDPLSDSLKTHFLYEAKVSVMHEHDQPDRLCLLCLFGGSRGDDRTRTTTHHVLPLPAGADRVTAHGVRSSSAHP